VTEPIGHARAFELLPWLVNGSLTATERDAVEQHIRACIACRRELKQQQLLRSAVRAQPTVHLSPHSGFDRLNREIGSTAAEPRADPRAAFAPLLRFAVVGGFGIVLLAMLLWLAPSAPRSGATGGYSTLATQTATNGTQLDLVFTQSITASDMQVLLDEIDGSITSGPTDAGRYTVRVANGNASEEEIARILARLMRDPRLRFAARSLSAAAP
jgi:anti-sigma factor RsiW